MKIAQLQLQVYDDKQKNLDQLHCEIDKIMNAAAGGNTSAGAIANSNADADTDIITNTTSAPDIFALGEMFICPYDTANFPVYAEEEGGPTWQALSDLAREYNIYLSAGTVPELADGKVYNTAYVFDRGGNQIARHRKVHLFDINIRGRQAFRESDTLTGGDSYTVFDTEFGRMGLAVCFDIRFPELFMPMVLDGAKAIFVPAAFNSTTGPAHWELAFRSRAVDNQCYMIGTSVAVSSGATYRSWGHSIVTDPWGRVVSQLDDRVGTAITDIDFNYVDSIREQLPIISARHPNVYKRNE